MNFISTPAVKQGINMIQDVNNGPKEKNLLTGNYYDNYGLIAHSHSGFSSWGKWQN